MNEIENLAKGLRAIAKEKSDVLNGLHDMIDALNFTAGQIEKLSAKLQVANMENGGGWIACEDRLPEDGQKVLATHEGGLNPERQVIEHIFKDGQFTLNWDMETEIGSPTFGRRYMGEVIAWMPKPEPYRP